MAWSAGRRAGHPPAPAAPSLGALLLAALLVLPWPQESGAAPFDRDEALAISQGARGRTLSDHALRLSDGTALRLSALAGRPVVVSLIFTSCHHTCPLITQRLARAVEVARAGLGADAFTVLTIGFDSPRDTPARLREFAARHAVDDPQWLFASADEPTVRALTAELGFLYAPSPRGFDHLAQITVLDGGLRVHTQVYGDAFEPPVLVEPLRRLALGQADAAGGLGGWLERVRLFCTVYDAGSGRYRFDYGLVVAIVTGVSCLLAVGVFVVRAWRDGPRPGASA